MSGIDLIESKRSAPNKKNEQSVIWRSKNKLTDKSERKKAGG